MSKINKVDDNPSFFTKWSGYFLKNWRVTIILIIASLMVGVMGISNNQRQDFPTIPTNYISVVAIYPGASAGDIEQQVVVPMERVVRDIEDVAKIRSTAGDSFGSLLVSMDTFEKSKMSKRAGEISNGISKEGLPSEVEVTVTVIEATGPTMALGIVSSGDYTTNDLLLYASAVSNEVESSSDEIKGVDISPSDEFEIDILLDSESLNEFGLSYDMISGIVQSNISSVPGGSVKADDGLYKAIVINAPVTTLEDVRNIAVGPLKLSDIAEIKRSPIDNESITYAGYVDGDDSKFTESVYLLVSKTDNGDSIRISDSVKDAISSLHEKNIIPNDIEIAILMDSAPEVERQISTLLSNALIGLILIIVILLFFINFRAAVVVSTILPLVFLITLAVLWQLGWTINILTLFGMIVALGVLVDNAIVIVEGIAQELEKGKKKTEAVLSAIKTFAPAVTSATVTTVVVFAAFGFGIDGIMGEFLKYIPFTIIIMLFASYFLALTVTPLFGKWLLKENKEVKTEKLAKWQKLLIIPAIVFYGQKAMNDLAISYKKMIKKALGSSLARALILVVTIIVIGAGFSFAGKVDGSQMPTGIDGSIMTINSDFPTGTTLETKKEVISKLGNKIIDLPHFQSMFYMDGQYYTTFTEPTQREDDITIFEISDELEKDILAIESQYEGLDIKASSGGNGPPQSEYDIVIEVKDKDLDTLDLISADLVEFINSKEGVQKTVNSFETNLVSSVQVDFNLDSLIGKQLNNMQVASAVRQTIVPSEIGSIVVREDGVSDRLFLGFKEEDRDSTEDLRNLVVDGQSSKLSEVADIKEVKSLNRISRIDGDRVVEISIDLDEDEDIVKFQESIEEYLGLEKDSSGSLMLKDGDTKLKEFGIHDESSVVFGGSEVDMSSDMNKLIFVSLLAVVIVYIVLVNQFNSYAKPALIMLSVVMAFAGVFPGLFIFDEAITMVSGLGMTALIGIAVNDAIVFIDTLNILRRDRPEDKLSDIISEAVYLRFKPILSTTMTTILGILPLTIADPFWTGIGVTLTAGLLFATIGTLFVVPIVYSIGCSFWKNAVLTPIDAMFKTKHRERYVERVYGKH